MRRVLTQGFSRFLRRRHAQRHFERRPLPGSAAPPASASTPGRVAGAPSAVAPGVAAPALPTPGQDALTAAAAGTPASALALLQSQADGLDAAEVACRLARDGPNDIQHEPPLPAWLHLWRCYLNPFNLLLTALAALSYLSADAKATVVIAAMVVLSTVIRFVQEGRSHRAAERLRAMVSNTATVIRRSAGAPTAKAPTAPTAQAAPQEIPLRDLVAGDIVSLSAGDMIPADCRVLSARDLFVAQSAMTGEAMPVEKFVQGAPASASGAPAGAGPFDQPNLVFMGTNVVSGTATALVVATGGRSFFGTLAAHATATDASGHSAPNAFQAGVNSVSWLLIRFAAVMVPIVFVVNGLTKDDWLQAFLFALSVAVGLTPEMLPMIVTSTLARGAVLLSRKQVVVKRLDAIQNFGAMDILCTDKTGTLTQDKIALARHADAYGQDTDEVLNFAFLNSHDQTGLKNLLDRAVLDHVELATELKLHEAYRKIDEIPFDFERRRARHAHLAAGCSLAGAHAGGDGRPQRRRVARGGRGGEDPATRAGQVLGGRRVRPDPDRLHRLPRPTERVCRAGAEAAGRTRHHRQGADGRQRSRHRAGVPPGGPDQAGWRCGDAGLASRGAQRRCAPGCGAGAQRVRQLTPLHKERIVRALRASGHVVGFMGDGINDAPALRAADIGISVDSAVDIAKEAADIILLEKSLLVLDDGVVEGRTTFCNMLKYIRMTASSNFGNVLSVLVASAFLPFLPMLPLQLLVQNLLYDIGQTGIPFDNVDPELVTRPLQWNPADIGRFMLFFGPISSLFDIITFAVMWWVFEANSLATQTLFQSGWFVVGLLTQTLVVHMVRTPKLPFVQSRAAAPLMAMTLAIMALGLWLPLGPLAGYFKLQALPMAYYGWLLAILIGYCVLTTLMKRLYIRRFGWQ